MSIVMTVNGKAFITQDGKVLTPPSQAVIIENQYSDATDKAYSSDYMNKNFAGLGFTQPLFVNRIGTDLATLELTAPTPDPINLITVLLAQKSDYDWLIPDFTFQRTLPLKTTLLPNTGYGVSLNFTTNYDVNLNFGAKMKISTDNGDTWTYVSSNKSYGSRSVVAEEGTNIEFTITPDLLSGATVYEAGTIIAFEFYTFQNDQMGVNLEVYCGVEVRGAVVNSTVQFGFRSVEIDTDQIADGSVTTDKLSPEVNSILLGRVFAINLDHRYNTMDVGDEIDITSLIGYNEFTLLKTLLASGITKVVEIDDTTAKYMGGTTTSLSFEISNLHDVDGKPFANIHNITLSGSGLEQTVTLTLDGAIRKNLAEELSEFTITTASVDLTLAKNSVYHLTNNAITDIDLAFGNGTNGDLISVDFKAGTSAVTPTISGNNVIPAEIDEVSAGAYFTLVATFIKDKWVVKYDIVETA